jgi:hypothetical protein
VSCLKFMEKGRFPELTSGRSTTSAKQSLASLAQPRHPASIYWLEMHTYACRNPFSKPRMLSACIDGCSRSLKMPAHHGPNSEQSAVSPRHTNDTASSTNAAELSVSDARRAGRNGLFLSNDERFGRTGELHLMGCRGQRRSEINSSCRPAKS